MEIIKLIVICYVLVDLTSFLGEIVVSIDGIKNKLLKLLQLLLGYLLTCNKCSSFYLSLILSRDLFISAVVALVVMILKEIEYKKIKTKL